MSSNLHKLQIEIPEINPQIFELDSVNEVPKINKESLKRANLHFWLDYNENIDKNTNETKSIKSEKK